MAGGELPEQSERAELQGQVEGVVGQPDRTQGARPSSFGRNGNRGRAAGTTGAGRTDRGAGDTIRPTKRLNVIWRGTTDDAILLLLTQWFLGDIIGPVDCRKNRLRVKDLSGVKYWRFNSKTRVCHAAYRKNTLLCSGPDLGGRTGAIAPEVLVGGAKLTSNKWTY